MTQTACVGGTLCGNRGHRIACRAVCAPTTKWLLVCDKGFSSWFLIPPDGAGFTPLKFNTYREAVSWRPGDQTGVDASETLAQAKQALETLNRLNAVLRQGQDAVALRQAQRGQGVIEQ